MAFEVEPEFDQLFSIDGEPGRRGLPKLSHRLPDYSRGEWCGSGASIYKVDDLFQHQTEAAIRVPNLVELENQISTNRANLGYGMIAEIAEFEIDRSQRPHIVAAVHAAVFHGR